MKNENESENEELERKLSHKDLILAFFLSPLRIPEFFLFLIFVSPFLRLERGSNLSQSFFFPRFFLIVLLILTPDYYPFAQSMPARTRVGSVRYRYSFNNKEQDNEIRGVGNSLDFGTRTYDSRIARYLSVDQYVRIVYNKSNYLFAGNSPIAFIDYNGGFMIDATSGRSRKQRPGLRRVLRMIANLVEDPKFGDHIIKEILQQIGATGEPNAEETVRNILRYNSGPAVIITIGLLNGQNHGESVEPALASYANGAVFIDGSLLKSKPNKKHGRENWNTDKTLLAIFGLIHEGMHNAEEILLGDVVPPDSKGIDNGERFEKAILGFDLGNVNDFMRNREKVWPKERGMSDRNALLNSVLREITHTLNFISDLSRNGFSPPKINQDTESYTKNEKKN